MLGTDHYNSNPSLDGFIDEPRLSSVARSGAWIAFQYANQNDAASITVAAEETLPP